jgi:hypothetical protein
MEANADGLNPLTMSLKASVTSQAKIGITPMAAHDRVCSEAPNIEPALYAKTSGPPTSPSTFDKFADFGAGEAQICGAQFTQLALTA